MLREDRELLADLKRVCNDAGLFALEYMAGDLAIAAEEAYALRLIELGERVLAHAKSRQGLGHNGGSTPLVIDAECVRMVEVPQQAGPRELPPGSQPDDAGL